MFSDSGWWLEGSQKQVELCCEADGHVIVIQDGTLLVEVTVGQWRIELLSQYNFEVRFFDT
jgi:hypothetical protein